MVRTRYSRQRDKDKVHSVSKKRRISASSPTRKQPSRRVNDNKLFSNANYEVLKEEFLAYFTLGDVDNSIYAVNITDLIMPLIAFPNYGENVKRDFVCLLPKRMWASYFSCYLRNSTYWPNWSNLLEGATIISWTMKQLGLEVHVNGSAPHHLPIFDSCRQQLHKQQYTDLDSKKFRDSGIMVKIT